MAILRLRSLSKTYGAPLALAGPAVVNVAVADASVAFEAGRIHAVCGENGAGKSTLLRMAAGLVTPDAGQVLINGKELSPHSPSGARAMGVAMVTQHFALAPALTVLENIALGERGPLELDKLAVRVRAVEEKLGISLPLSARAGDLSVGDKQRTELCRALLVSARVLILDEPTAILAPSEVSVLYTLLRKVADEGTAVIVVTHKLDEVERFCDAVTIMRRGQVLLTTDVPSPPERPAFTKDLMQRVMGEAKDISLERTNAELGNVVLELARVPGVAGLSLRIRAGEVVGVAGIEGNGQAELVQALFQDGDVTSVLVDGRPMHPGDISFVHEDRHEMGLVLPATAAENLLLGDLAEVSRGPFIDAALLHARAEERAKLAAYTQSLELAAGALSGGNQQKLVVGRALGRAKARVFVFVHPTRGVDIGAAREIHARIQKVADHGAAVIVVSSDTDELRALASRVVVLSKHAFAAELGPDVAEDKLGAAMLTGAPS
jgi:simple sugar transport system ATP-binding protein